MGLAERARVLGTVGAVSGGAAPPPTVLLAEAQPLAPRRFRAARLCAPHSTAVADAVARSPVCKLGAPGFGAAAPAPVLRTTLGFVPRRSNATRLFAPNVPPRKGDTSPREEQDTSSKSVDVISSKALFDFYAIIQNARLPTAPTQKNTNSGILFPDSIHLAPPP